MFCHAFILFALTFLFMCITVKDRIHLMAALAQPYTSITGQHLNRERALAMLKGCARNRLYRGCNEDTAEYLIGLYKRGDKSLLNPLVDAGLVSDGALSETLGSFYGELLSERPIEFLNALHSRTRKDQEKLALLAAVMDGSGMSNKMFIVTIAKLRRISSQKNNHLAGVAKVCLKEIEKENQRLSSH